MIEVNRDGEVWVYAEQQGGVLREVVLELCGKARELADELNVPAGAVLIGSQLGTLPEQLIAHGIDHVYGLEDARLEHYQTLPYARIACHAIETSQAADRALRGHAAGSRSGTARRLRDACRHDRRLHRPGDPGRHGTADQRGSRETAAADPPGVRRQHHCHDRELRHVAADGDGPRRRDAAA